MPATLLGEAKKSALADTVNEVARPRAATLLGKRGANQVSAERSYLREFEQLADEGATDVTGVRWKGAESHDTAIHACLWFFDDGRLHYGRNKTNASAYASRWQQRGATLLLTINDCYAEWLLTLEGDTLRGRGQNCVKYEWTMEFTRGA